MLQFFKPFLILIIVCLGARIKTDGERMVVRADDSSGSGTV